MDPRNKVCDGEATWTLYAHGKTTRICEAAATRARKGLMEGQACGKCHGLKHTHWEIEPMKEAA